MPFTYIRVVRFADTDAAGVVYFANLLEICHEAYEASLGASGINLRQFFGGQGSIALPIVHAEADFSRPVFCGDKLIVLLTPQLLQTHEFQITYKMINARTPERTTATGLTRHVCIQPAQRVRQALPKPILAWLHQWRDPDSPMLSQTSAESAGG